ncbi:SMP-30/gluconolactonase/LRE family protein [Frankia sp. CNm7]|uniref:SMP-30/gluconolactonase/LRE family protein n=1 Tax=Frankia nepalensis TaxID=1836974 RepID=A0A937RCP2_9ACTN|nr:SMP-30/gluconolactonase/LRE family protein [Frankia nepalensis]MBL7496692.1 SMP-30/gluconolactonase/LRE family protein [Frankia nepalensis]MBL7511078.1 SMP-30/gluconolactonase/LRE family protein [Frankia nepalensis]MBL7516700.1 SMP-30/gluconolactonase/LRE family protein [Frankia nepalensis]MBL7627432.1 SMP-30/gluconolactonase/LRE family protein [Frankia nepalensis]
MGSRAATVLRDGFTFPEGLRWHDDRLWVSDQTTGTVWTVADDGMAEPVVEVPGGASGLGWLADGDLLVVSMTNRQLLRVDTATGGTAVHASLADLPGYRLNDMVVDEEGRAYVGDFGFDPRAFAARFGGAALMGGEAPTSILARVDPDGSVRVAADGLRFPNGCVITTDGGTLIVAETFGRRLTAFDRSETGDLFGRRVWATLDARPDGICLDAEGAVWVANAGATECLRVAAPRAGQPASVVDRVVTGAPVYSCALGGADGRTLFLATAPPAAASQTVSGALAEGRIETARIDVPAAGSP